MFNKKMKTLMAGLALALALPAGQALAQQGKELLVATDTAFVPFEFKQNGKYTGFDIDLWDAVAKKANLNYRFQHMDFNGFISGLQTRTLDAVLAGITHRFDRKHVIDFFDRY